MVFHSLKNKQHGSAHLVVLVLAVLVVIGAIGAYVATGGFGKKTENSSASGTEHSTVTKSITASTPAAVKTLFAGVKAGDYDVKCTYVTPPQDPASPTPLLNSGPGTIYLSGATKLRVDTTFSNKPGHFVRQGDSVYIWVDGQKQGSKFPITDPSSTSSSKYSAGSFAENTDKYNLSCQSIAHLSANTFALPTDVTFVDINSQTHTSTSNP